MFSYNNFLLILLTIFSANYVTRAEFVPAWIWGSVKPTQNVPALHKVSEDSFKDTILEYLQKKSLYIVVFAEHTLSPEDFAQRNQAGEITFPNLLNLKKSAPLAYLPYVQNPIGAIKQLDKPVTELSIGSLINNPDVPKDNILIIDLNDAKDDEPRIDMLSRHDTNIIRIYKDLAKQHENILAIYTAHHTSWVAPEEISHKKTRDILQNNDVQADGRKIFQDTNFLLFLNDSLQFNTTEKSTILKDLTYVGSNETNNILDLKFRATDYDINFNITNQTNGYWQLENVVVKDSGNTTTQLKFSPISAPLAFSYYCHNLILTTDGANLTLPGFQLHPFRDGGNGSKFGDAYDCVGFTSIPIWSGLFVTAILLSILTFGLTMMMDIKTMDRFDDAKGKTIVINAAE